MLKYEHPAFGLISVTRPQSSPGVTLFGSDLQHQGYISVEVKTASMDRELNRDWYYPADTVLRFSMSEAQWARFVSGAGRSQATPVTLERVREGNLVSVPSIERPEESRKDVFNTEFQENLEAALAEFRSSVSELQELSNQKAVGKTRLKQIATDLSRKLGNLPSNLNFAVESFREATETVVEEAKSEIDAHFTNAAYRVGLKGIETGDTNPRPPLTLPYIQQFTPLKEND